MAAEHETLLAGVADRPLLTLPVDIALTGRQLVDCYVGGVKTSLIWHDVASFGGALECTSVTERIKTKQKQCHESG